MNSGAPSSSKPSHRRWAELAAVLSRAAARDEIDVNYALRVLRHQLRVMNVNKALSVLVRSVGAQAAIDQYAAAGTPLPKNGSGDALHCDHVWAIRATDLDPHRGVDDWLIELERLRLVVCVTATENYRLENVERSGLDGWDKYSAAGVELIDLAARPTE